MLKITLPTNFKNERSYISDVIFSDFLGVEFDLTFEEGIKSSLISINNKNLIIEDHFFNQFDEKTGYLHESNIPGNVSFFSHELMAENDLPVIFGEGEIVFNENEIICKADLFASAFFMLTRWEETVIKTWDSHNRFPGTESLAFRNNFLHRPVVNEYVEFLWNLLKKAGYDGERKLRRFNVIPTHDVDFFRKWPNFRHFAKTISGDIIKRKSFKLLFKNISDYFNGRDPYLQFEKFMDLSEKYGLQSHFFFMAGGITSYDNHFSINDEEVKAMIGKIIQRGHSVGIHPSYDSYNNHKIFNSEKETLEAITEKPVLKGRQHFLRYKLPETWQMWDDAGMLWDSGMYYTNEPGFRSGCCYEYPLFNVKSRQKLNLREKPLVFMEIAWIVDPARDRNEIKDLISKVKKYNGDFIMLWHNSNIDHCNRELFDEVYEKIISEK
ncbi:MAG: hypothetical protein A2W91_10130 [Bacteroidetes bacterium GWF2_38_335]|nr:MAG: hypothetical protein A2W91_10130 [Bacteroidetes bacterium GWF2_38_335]HBS88018.1 hypothetical protein [Bacteroidales bacterium]